MPKVAQLNPSFDMTADFTGKVVLGTGATLTVDGGKTSGGMLPRKRQRRRS